MPTLINYPDLQSVESPIAPMILQQNGTNNFGDINFNVGELYYPNCRGCCPFTILHIIPNIFNGVLGYQIEAVIGVVFAFSSSEQSRAETHRRMIEIQKNRALSLKLC